MCWSTASGQRFRERVLVREEHLLSLLTPPSLPRPPAPRVSSSEGPSARAHARFPAARRTTRLSPDCNEVKKKSTKIKLIKYTTAPEVKDTTAGYSIMRYVKRERKENNKLKIKSF